MVIALCSVLSIVFAFHQYGRRGPEPPAHSSDLIGFDFTWVDGHAITEQNRSKVPSFELEPFGDTFSVQESPPPTAPGLRYSLHARLTGPNGQLLSCFLARWPNGTHYCPEGGSLPSGEWHVNVTLVRIPAPKAPPECAPSTKVLSRLSVLDYVLQGNFPTFKHYFKCMKYPYQSVLEATWTKEDFGSMEERTIDGGSSRSRSINSSGSSKGTALVSKNKPCIGPGGPGTWVKYPGSCKDSGLCIGAMDKNIKMHESNQQRGMQHIFKPFACRPRFLTLKQARSCTDRLQLALAGDSRTLHLVSGFQVWLGEDAVSFLPLYRPYRLGLTHALAMPAGDALREAIRSGRTVLINSVLHDVAEFFSTTTAADVIHSWSEYVTCPASCAGKLALKCGCRKTWAIKAYLNAIRKLRDDINAAREGTTKDGTPQPRVFWVSLHKRPPSPPDIFYDWQTADIIRELETAAMEELSSAGVEHIDLRWMTGAAPGQWWDDPVHFGKERSSLFLHATLQALLSRVCEEHR